MRWILPLAPVIDKHCLPVSPHTDDHEQGHKTMKLNFSNPNRSFDDSKNRVLFWGYDNVFEVTFFIEADALLKLYPETDKTEPVLLKAFDKCIQKIHEVAAKVYEHSGKRRNSYILAAGDF
jgi:hypothetical protein